MQEAMPPHERVAVGLPIRPAMQKSSDDTNRIFSCCTFVESAVNRGPTKYQRKPYDNHTFAIANSLNRELPPTSIFFSCFSFHESMVTDRTKLM